MAWCSLTAITFFHQAWGAELRGRFAATPGVTRGAAYSSGELYTWGRGLHVWDLSRLKSRRLIRETFAEGGCIADLDGDGNVDFTGQTGEPLGDLVVYLGPKWVREVVDRQVDMHDCVEATLFGRRGLLMVQRGLQVRFYERVEGSWRYREIYSFYTASYQGGLMLMDVNRDGRVDILCGNYWIRSPEQFDLPWRLFAINVQHERPQSANSRFAMTLDGVVVSQGHMNPGRVAVFIRPGNPEQLWTERRLTGSLANPHGLDAGDLAGNGSTDVVVADAHRLRLLGMDGQIRAEAPLKDGIAVFLRERQAVVVERRRAGLWRVQ